MLEHSVAHILSQVFKSTPTLQKGGEELLFYCPKCNHHKRKLNVNTETGHYHCWVCDFKGRGFVKLLRSVNAPSHFYSHFKDVKYVNQSNSIYKDKDNEKLIDLELPNDYQPIYKKSKSVQYNSFLQYCFKRKLSIYDMVRYNIGYCTSGEFANKLIIPSYDKDQKLNFYCGRDIYSTQYKYKLCNSSKNIVPFESHINFNRPITITEGAFDAISIRYNVIPLFGTIMSNKLKYELIDKHPPRVNIILDDDAYLKAIHMCEFLMQNDIDAHLVKLNDKDPNELGFDKIWEIIDNTPKLTEFKLFSEKIKLKI